VSSTLVAGGLQRVLPAASFLQLTAHCSLLTAHCLQGPVLPQLTPVHYIISLNTRLLRNCLDGVDDTLGGRRVTADTNSLAFLAAHLTESRHYACSIAGRPLTNPLEGRLKGKTLDDVGPLPSLAEIVAAWDAVSEHLRVVLSELTAEDLAREATRRLPGSDGTVGTVLPFLAQHDSYHIGQMAIVRRQLGLPAMSYK